MQVEFTIDIDINGLDTTVAVVANGNAYDFDYYVYHNGNQVPFSRLSRVDRDNIHDEAVEQFRSYVPDYITSQL